MINKKSSLLFVLCSGMLVVGLLLSIRYGAADISYQDVRHALFYYQSDNLTDNIIVTSRLPRALGAILVGALLAVSGALMQGITRNYLASPSILGVSEGSALFVTMGLVFLAASSFELLLLSFAGSLVAVVLVFGMARVTPNGMQPVRLAIIGMVIATFFDGLAVAIGYMFQSGQDVTFWYNARLDKVEMGDITIALPFVVLGLLASLALARSVTVISLGEETAGGLGVNTALIRTLAMLAVTVMTGSAVAIGGNIAFVGLVVPHIARFLAGSDYRLFVPVSGLLGAVFVCYADIGSRFFNPPYETPIMIVISIICIPFFIYLIHKKGGTAGV